MCLNCRLLPALASLVLLSILAGCGERRPAGPAEASAPCPYDRVMDGVVGRYASLAGSGDRVLRGYSLVAGLGENGSSECPRNIRRRIATQMHRHGIGRTSTGTEDITAELIINDMDTAPVVVSAEIPPGTPPGMPVDAFVSAVPGLQTRSLDGGNLYAAELHRVQAEDNAVREGKALALARGEVFINPFIDPAPDGDANQADPSRVLQGRIIGGCTALEQRPIMLVLHHPDYGLAQSIQESINEKFLATPRVAKAVSPSFIEITVPPRYRQDHERFLQELLPHVYIPRTGPHQERKARRLGQEILQPEAAYEHISLIWETMGRQVWPVIRPLYTHANPSVSYHAARAGLRQGDRQGLEVMIDAATDEGHPHRMEAVGELGRTREASAGDALRRLLDDRDTQVRVGAYEALADSGIHGGIERIRVDDGHFEIDLVPTRGKFLIYASQERRQRIALFGPAMQVTRPVFFAAPNDLVTLLARPGEDKLCVFRRVGAQKQLTDPMYVSFDVKSLLTVLGTRPAPRPDGTRYGLGMTYSQVVSVLYRLCQDGPEKRIPADFILQRSRQADRIYSGPEPVSRPDTTSQ